MDNREKTIEKISKLLALGDSPNQAEAEASLAKAYELMSRHNLLLEDIDASSKAFKEQLVFEGNELPFKVHLIASIISPYFGCEMVGGSCPDGGKAIKLVGRPEKLAVGGMVFNFLMMTYDQLYRQFLGETDVRAVRDKNPFESGGSHSELLESIFGDMFGGAARVSFQRIKREHTPETEKSFFIGLTGGILEQLRSAKSDLEDEWGLVIVNEDSAVQKALARLPEKHPDPSDFEQDNINQQALRSGHFAGQDLQLVQGLNEGQTNKIEGAPDA